MFQCFQNIGIIAVHSCAIIYCFVFQIDSFAQIKHYFCTILYCPLIYLHLLSLSLPYADEGIRAGFPSPAQDYMEQAIDLNKELIKHPSSTFYGRVVGDSMKDEGIGEGDILVIDKSLELIEGDLAVCYVDGEFTVKRVSYPRIKVTADNDFMVWGIVTYTIKKNRRRR